MNARQLVARGACGHSFTVTYLEGERVERVRGYAESTVCNACWSEQLDASQYQRQARASRALFRARRRANRERLAARGARI